MQALVQKNRNITSRIMVQYLRNSKLTAMLTLFQTRGPHISILAPHYRGPPLVPGITPKQSGLMPSGIRPRGWSSTEDGADSSRYMCSDDMYLTCHPE